MDGQKELRRHLLELLDGKSAHISLETALNEFPLSKINLRLANSPHTAWELLEHLRIAQSDILEFSRAAAHVSPAFPEGYWHNRPAAEQDWRDSVRQILGDLRAMRELVADEQTDLYAPIEWGTGQTLLREALLVADHNAYHIGQLVLLLRMSETE